MIELVVRPAGGPEQQLSFDRESLLVGRSRVADLHVPDAAMSRSHARLYREGKAWFVEDLGSRNGTLLNGTPVRDPLPLAHGDLVVMGGSSLTVQELDEANAEPDSSSQHAVYTPAEQLVEQGSDLAGPATPEHDLRRALARLQILNEIHRALGRSVRLDELLGLILDRVFDHLEPEEAAIFLSREGDTGYDRVAGRSTRGSEVPALVSKHLLDEVAGKGMAALVLDASTDVRFKDAASLLAAGVRSLVAAPLLSPEGSLGMIAVESMARERQFTEDDMELLASLASVAALRIRNLRLAAAAIERARLEREVTLARQIQVALLPAALPSLQRLEMVGRNVPSRVVSGDFYKAVTRAEGAEVVLLVADVSGKGIAAALLTASLEALTVVPVATGAPPDRICDTVSELLWERTRPEKFATAFVAVLDNAGGELRYCNAGHAPALVVRCDSSCEWLASTGMPLGIFPGASYALASTVLAPGDLLVIYTDGISEAENEEEEEYGTERLATACVAACREPLAALAMRIEQHIESFAGGRPFLDDRTLLLVRRTG